MRTLACDPVATTRSHCRRSAAVAALVIGGGSTWTRSGDKPALANCAWMNSISNAHDEYPFGDGATITALPHFSALMILLAGVAAGLVDGVIAATTPTARAISTIPVAEFRLITPQVLASCKSRRSPSVFR